MSQLEKDPTYVKAEIEANLEYDVAFVLSECLNDRAPIGWGKYTWIARTLLGTFDIRRKPGDSETTVRQMVDDINRLVLASKSGSKPLALKSTRGGQIYVEY